MIVDGRIPKWKFDQAINDKVSEAAGEKLAMTWKDWLKHPNNPANKGPGDHTSPDGGAAQ